tara:strand:- start:603 stop:770 length:168 start_codon:yes stop_codon:yes gene_type:complete
MKINAEDEFKEGALLALAHLGAAKEAFCCPVNFHQLVDAAIATIATWLSQCAEDE